MVDVDDRSSPASSRPERAAVHAAVHAAAPAAAPAAPAAPAADVPWVARVQASQKGRDKSRVGRKITRAMMQTIERWKLVEPGDRLMVAVSGGKDSYTLLDLLWEAKQRAPFSFDVIAVHLDQAQPGYDGTPLVGWLSQSGIPFEIVREDTYSIVVQGTKPGQAYCFLCSRLRRGILYSQAERLGCNKIALGHHRDDALETMLMNLCYAGKLQAMPARYTTDDQRFVVVRPLIDCAEKDIAAWAAERAYPILPCNLCGSQDGLKRDAMNDLLSTLEKTIPDVRAVMHHALSNVRPTHLLDKDVADVWATRPADVRPQEVADPGPRRMTGEVVASSSSTASMSSAATPLVRRGALTIVAEGSGGLGGDEP
jgi:tRNA 2-thiocytidine biosynthesis protein TtcA